ncbi:MAG: D-alanyl-D-alanine carboxypeptidase, partial [Xanthobacteraceae bacterium]|nr:D-alanyl-D-alanine carboxypeptidase [Xanthobacteraceae bacterium]
MRITTSRIAAYVRLGARLAVCAMLAVPVAAGAANQSITGQKKEEFATAAPYAILIDADSGSVLFEKAADTQTPPSSMAKLMTVEVVFHALKEGKLNPDD